jgi:uncharacterized protein (DUF736 family)
MAKQYDNTNRGVLFKNDKKTADNHPDYKGKINTGGEDFWLSAWIKDGDKGKYMSLSVTPMEEKQANGKVDRTEEANRKARAVSDESIPF